MNSYHQGKGKFYLLSLIFLNLIILSMSCGAIGKPSASTVKTEITNRIEQMGVCGWLVTNNVTAVGRNPQIESVEIIGWGKKKDYLPVKVKVMGMCNMLYPYLRSMGSVIIGNQSAGPASFNCILNTKFIKDDYGSWKVKDLGNCVTE